MNFNSDDIRQKSQLEPTICKDFSALKDKFSRVLKDLGSITIN